MKRWWLIPRWCRILMWPAALIGFAFGHTYAVSHRAEPEPVPIPDRVWEKMAFEAELYALQIQAAMEPE